MNRINFGILFLVIATIFGVVIGKEKFYADNTLHIALVGPMQNSNGEAMRQGVQMYLDRINQQGGISGKKLKLLTFDDKSQAKLAEKQALKVVNSKAIAVIGHYSSSASYAAGKIYQKYSIPAITGSATADEITKNNDWYFRVIFNNSDQSALLANYTKKILNYDKAYIFSDDSVYGKTLAATFAKTASRVRLKIEQQWSFSSSNDSSFDE
ncbi:MAG: ABC transporter substrate-binding protein, partial [Proteobacteria bacterium]|nr:ABC transporter substrate-binding protein [Pseudomonadota bacterium]